MDVPLSLGTKESTERVIEKKKKIPLFKSPFFS